MGALFDLKCACNSILVYVYQADAEKCIFVWTILLQTPQHTLQVMYDAGQIKACFLLSLKERRMLSQGRLSFTVLIGE